MVWRAEAGSAPLLFCSGPKYSIVQRQVEHCVTFYLFKNFASPAYCETDTWPDDKLDMDEWCKLVLWMVFKKVDMMGKLSAVPLAEDSKCSKEDLTVKNKKAVLCHHSGQRSMLHEATATFDCLLSFLYLFLFFTYVGVKHKHNEAHTHTHKKPKHGPRHHYAPAQKRKTMTSLFRQLKAESEQKTSGAFAAAPSPHAWNRRTAKHSTTLFNLRKPSKQGYFLQKKKKEHIKETGRESMESYRDPGNLVQQQQQCTFVDHVASVFSVKSFDVLLS